MMKATGVVRKLDDLGRVVIPKELRRTLGIGEKDGLEIFVNGQDIVLRKYAPGCSVCGAVDEVLHTYRNKQACESCIDEFAKLAKKPVLARR
jgi:transcriptional pleiotropic regulator of transition state genes